MLSAVNNAGENVTLARLTLEEIQHRRREKHYCPVCYQEVFIKAGTEVIPHFAHYQKNNCSYSKGESDYHQQAKLSLYKWIEMHGIHVEMEYYIREIEQRPDLYFRIGNKQIVLEFQSSLISTDEFIKRNEGYQKLHITPIWILGENLLHKTDGTIIYTPKFMKHAIHQYRNNGVMFLYFYCPNKDRLSIYQHLYYIKQTKAYAQKQCYILSHIHFSRLFQETTLDDKLFINTWIREKRHFRLQNRPTHGRERHWETYIYYKKRHRTTMHSIIFMPIIYQCLLKQSLWEWQSKVLYTLERIPKNRKFTKEYIQQKARLPKIKRNEFPLLKHYTDPIEEYLYLLYKVNIVKIVADNCYYRIAEILDYKNIYEAIKGDEEMVNYIWNRHIMQV